MEKEEERGNLSRIMHYWLQKLPLWHMHEKMD
jgi:hypothetical protein